jgi:hypothetical protein
MTVACLCLQVVIAASAAWLAWRLWHDRDDFRSQRHVLRQANVLVGPPERTADLLP